MHLDRDHLLTAATIAEGESSALPRRMIDREKVVAILRKRFAGAPVEQVAAAANAIVALKDEWSEVAQFDADMERHLRTCPCEEAEGFVHRFRQGGRFKLYEHLGND